MEYKEADKTAIALTAAIIRPAAHKMATPEQLQALECVARRWPTIVTPFTVMMCDTCLIGQVGYEDGSPAMWIGIETDGCTHS